MLVAQIRPDGRQLATIEQVSELINNVRVRSVTSGRGDSQPSWSPDGTRIVFTRARSLYVVPAAGGAARRIVAAGVQPVWVSRR